MRVVLKKLIILSIFLISAFTTVNAQLTVNITGFTNPTCGDVTGGRIDIQVLNETPPLDVILFNANTGIPISNSPGGTLPNLFFDGLTEGDYFVVVSDLVDNDITPDQSLVLTQPTITILQPVPTNICVDAGDIDLSLIVIADVGGGTFTFNGPGVTPGTSTFNPAGLGGTTVNIDVDYNIPPSCNAPTVQIIYDVDNLPDATLSVSDAVTCNPAPGDVIVTVFNAEAGVDYELTVGGTPLVPPVTGTGAGADLNLVIAQIDAPTTTTVYTVQATRGACIDVPLTDQSTVTVNDAPDPGLSVSDSDICNPAEGDVIITITGAETGVTYELTNAGVPLVPPVTGVGAGADLDLTILQANAPTTTTTYTVVASVNGCPNTNLTDQPTVTVNDQPDNTLSVSDATICSPATGDIALTITTSEAGVNYELTIGGTPLVPPVTGLGTGADLDLTILQANAPVATTTYTVVASRSGCLDVNLLDQPVVTVNNLPNTGLSVSDATICNPAEADVIITIFSAEAGVNYELTDGGTPLTPPVTGTGTGADLNLVVLQADAPTADITYTVEASIPGCATVDLIDQPNVTVNAAPNNGLSVSDASICSPASGDVIITVSSAENGVNYELTVGGTPLVPPVTGTGTGVDLDLTILQANAPVATTIYTVVASIPGCSDVNLLDQSTVTVSPSPNTGLTVSDPIICNPAEGDVIVTILTAETGVTYELKNGAASLVPPVTGVGAGVDLDLTILQVNAPAADITYTVEATAPGCPPVNLVDQAIVTVNAQPNDGLAVSDPIICNPAAGDVVITITGAESGVNYELTDGGTPLVPPVSGVGAGADLDLTILQASAPTANITYTIVASIVGCSNVNLIDQANVTVNNAPDANLTVTDATICNPSTGDLIVTVVGAEAGVTYELTNGGTPLAPPVFGIGAGADLDLTVLQANTPTTSINYTVVATLPGCTVNLNDQAVITVNNAPNASLLVSDAVVCNPAEGDITITITSAEAGVDYELTIGGVPLTTPVIGTGAGADLDLVVLQANAPTTTTTYTVVASVVGCADVNLLDQPVVTVNDSPDPGLAVSDATECVPATGDVDFTITNAELGVTYELTIGGTSLTPAVSGIGAGVDLDLTILQANVPTTTTTYTIVASIGGCSNVNLTDQPVLSILTPDVNLAVSDPGVCNPATGDVIITVSGAEAGVTYEVTDGGVALVPPVTGVGAGADLDLTILQANAPTTNISYTIQATNPGCPTVDLIDQADVVINTSAPVDPPVLSGPALGCDNETAVAFVASAVPNGVTYQWELDEGFGYVNQGETSNTLTLDFSALGTGSFLLRALAENGCGAGPFSADFAFDIVTAPTIDTQPSDQMVCEGTDATFSVAVTATNPSFQWQVDTGSGFNDIAGETNATLTVSSVGPTENGNQYQVIVRESGSCPLISSIATLSVNQNTTIITQPADQTVNVGDDATFTVDASGVNLTYQWQVSTDGGASFGDLASATTETLVVGNAS